MKKITYYEVIAIMNFFKTLENKKLPLKLSIIIARNFSLLEKEYNLYQELLKSIFNRYKDSYVINEKGQPIYNNGLPVIKEEKNQDFNNDLMELLNSEIEIKLYTLTEEDLDKVFDYDENKFDVLSIKEINSLINILV